MLPKPNFEVKSTAQLKASFQYQIPSGMTLQTRPKKPPYVAPPPQIKNHVQQHEKNFKSQWKKPQHVHQYAPASKTKEEEEAVVSSQLLQQIKKLSTPEEIQAWRDERKKKYPTMANVEMRQKAQEQRQRRGERLLPNQSRFSRPKDRRQMRKGNAQQSMNNNQKIENEQGPQKRKQFGNRNKKQQRRTIRVDEEKITADRPETKTINVEPVPERSECGGILMFQGTSKFPDYKHENWRKKVTALSALFDMYGSDEDDDDDDVSLKSDNDVTVEEHKSNFTVEDVTDQQFECLNNNDNVDLQSMPLQEEPDASWNNNTTCLETECEINDKAMTTASAEEEQQNQNEKDFNVSNADANEAPDEAPILHNDQMPSKLSKPQASRAKDRQPFKRKLGLDYRKVRLRKQNTMLEKLLETDIRHERNVLLQCVRFVCENNFFDIGSKRSKTK